MGGGGGRRIVFPISFAQEASKICDLTKVNKILPEGLSPVEIQQLLEVDPDYFNDIDFDTAVLSVLHILVILDKLYVLNVKRDDENGQSRAQFSKLTGLHSMGWAPEARQKFIDAFNEHSDKVRAGLQKLSTRIDTAKLSKDKTRSLQFLPTGELMERTIKYLLEPETPYKDACALEPDKLVKKLSEVDLDAKLLTFKPTDLPSTLSVQGNVAGEALAVYVQKQWWMHANVRKLVESFREDRKLLSHLARPRPTAVFDLARCERVFLPAEPAAVYMDISERAWDWYTFAQEPENSNSAVIQKKYEVSVLILAGLLQITDSGVQLVPFVEKSPEELQALTALSKLDKNTDMQAISNCMPRTDGAGPRTDYDSKAALQVVEALSKYQAGEEVSDETIAGLPDPFPVAAIGSQLEKRKIEEDTKAGDRVPHADGRKLRRVARTAAKDFELTTEMLSEYPDVVSKTLKFILTSKQLSFNMGKIVTNYKGGLTQDEGERAVLIAFKFLQSLGVGKVGVQLSSIEMFLPPVADREHVVNGLGRLLKTDVQKMREAMRPGKKPESTTFNRAIFDQWLDRASVAPA